MLGTMVRNPPLRRWPMEVGQCNQNFRTEGSRLKPRHGDRVFQARLRKIRFAESNEKLLKDLKQLVYKHSVFQRSLVQKWRIDYMPDARAEGSRRGSLCSLPRSPLVRFRLTPQYYEEKWMKTLRYLGGIGGLLANIVCGGERRKKGSEMMAGGHIFRLKILRVWSM